MSRPRRPVNAEAAEREDERAWLAGELDWTAPDLTPDERRARRIRVGRMYLEGRLEGGADPFEPLTPPPSNHGVWPQDGSAPRHERPAQSRPKPPRRPEPKRAREVPETLHHWTGFAAIAAAHAANRCYQRALAAHGLSVGDFVALAVVVHRPHAFVGTIAFRMGIGRSRASDLILHLEGSGWIERVPSPRDRRRKAVVVTREGAITYDDACSSIAAADTEWQEVLTPAERTALRAALLRLAPNHSDWAGLSILAG